MRSVPARMSRQNPSLFTDPGNKAETPTTAMGASPKVGALVEVGWLASGRGVHSIGEHRSIWDELASGTPVLTLCDSAKNGRLTFDNALSLCFGPVKFRAGDFHCDKSRPPEAIVPIRSLKLRKT